MKKAHCVEMAGIEPATAALAGRARSLAVIPMQCGPPAALTFPTVELSKCMPNYPQAGLSRDGRNRTLNPRFWRPVLFLS
jgi:hypothetical protein